MTLAAVIERSRTDREAWWYTSLEDIEVVFGSGSSASFPRKRESSASDSEHRTHAAHRHAPLDPRFHGDDACDKTRASLAFLNGVWQPEQSCFKGFPADLLQGNAEEGYRLTFAKQTGTASPLLELLFLAAPGSGPAEADIKLRIVLESDANLTLIERHRTPSGAAPFAHVIENEIILEPRTKLTHGKIVTASSRHVHLVKTQVTVAQGASYDNFALLCGGKPSRNEIDVTLAGERAECRLHGAMLLRGDEHADTTIRAVHAAPHTSSRQHYKSVIAGEARGVFQGKIVVNEGAQKADGYQLCRALLLSGEAEMDAKPELEIYADDVKCSHGCTIGNLDETALFYLRSRGIGEAEARALLVEAFVSEITDGLSSSELREAFQYETRKWLREHLSENGLIPPPSRGRLGGGANLAHDKQVKRENR
ncbi:MAG: Fe-S cluster assembly protein SufD [Alphaproteobacteria bacterium]|nr:Fe-S cluster assembly protein SufD [Alphaproteobacteria bacterium]